MDFDNKKIDSDYSEGKFKLTQLSYVQLFIGKGKKKKKKEKKNDNSQSKTRSRVHKEIPAGCNESDW